MIIMQHLPSTKSLSLKSIINNTTWLLVLFLHSSHANTTTEGTKIKHARSHNGRPGYAYIRWKDMDLFSKTNRDEQIKRVLDTYEKILQDRVEKDFRHKRVPTEQNTEKVIIPPEPRDLCVLSEDGTYGESSSPNQVDINYQYELLIETRVDTQDNLSHVLLAVENVINESLAKSILPICKNNETRRRRTLRSKKTTIKYFKEIGRILEIRGITPTAKLIGERVTPCFNGEPGVTQCRNVRGELSINFDEGTEATEIEDEILELLEKNMKDGVYLSASEGIVKMQLLKNLPASVTDSNVSHIEGYVKTGAFLFGWSLLAMIGGIGFFFIAGFCLMGKEFRNEFGVNQDVDSDSDEPDKSGSPGPVDQDTNITDKETPRPSIFDSMGISNRNHRSEG